MSRSLLMAGGGLKVAAQAGVLQVWLDEAGIVFDHADAASGGCMNLAMWCQGRTGTEIADAWRCFRPLDIVSLNVPTAPFLRRFGAALTMTALRQKQFARWRLDWPGIRGSGRVGTFNVYDFTAGALQVVESKDITEDLMVAAMSLPQWFPPIEVGGHLMTDAVFVTDANVEAAIAHGADEIWVVWTVSRKGDWRPFGVNQYFDIVEISANGAYDLAKKAIDKSNADFQAGRHSRYDRPILLRELAIEVPLNYVLNTRATTFPPAVDLGMRKAREWCRANGYPLRPGSDGTSWREAVVFTEAMAGTVAFGPDGTGHDLRLELQVVVHDPRSPLGPGGLVGDLTGTVVCQALGGRLRIVDSRFEQFVTVPGGFQMRYQLVFRDSTERLLTLHGVKHLTVPGTFDQTRRLQVLLFAGRLPFGPVGTAVPIATGELTLSWRAAVGILRTFRARGRTRWTRLRQSLAYLRHYLSVLGRMKQG